MKYSSSHIDQATGRAANRSEVRAGRRRISARMAVLLVATGTSSFAIGSASIAAAAVRTKTVADPASLVAKGWSVETRLNGDLTGDGVPDAVILAVDGPAKIVDMTDAKVDGNRRIIVARKDPGGFTVVGDSATAVICRACGGAFWGVLPAAIEMSIKSGVLVVNQTRGSRDLVDFTHRYRVEKNHVRLIGRDEVNTDRLNGSVVTRSTNYLTGLSIVTVAGKPEEPATPGRTKGKPSVVYIETVDLS